MDTYTTTLAIGPLGLSLHTADAELYAAQQRAYHAFAIPPQPSLRGGAPGLRRSNLSPGRRLNLYLSRVSLLPAYSRVACASLSPPGPPRTRGPLSFRRDACTLPPTITRAPSISLSSAGRLTLTSLHPFEAADYFVRTALALLAFEAGGLLFHAAGLAYHDRGYAFFGHSGSGKTTVARVSSHATVLNDDLVVLWPGASHPAAMRTREADRWQLIATPFSNPTQVQPAGHQRVPLTALYRLIQDRRVFLEALDPAVATAEIVASSPIVCADPDRAAALLDRAAQLTRAVPVQRLHFLPDASFWDVIDPR